MELTSEEFRWQEETDKEIMHSYKQHTPYNQREIIGSTHKTNDLGIHLVFLTLMIKFII